MQHPAYTPVKAGVYAPSRTALAPRLDESHSNPCAVYFRAIIICTYSNLRAPQFGRICLTVQIAADIQTAEALGKAQQYKCRCQRVGGFDFGGGLWVL
jgi:hypothetical protein